MRKTFIFLITLTLPVVCGSVFAEDIFGGSPTGGFKAPGSIDIANDTFTDKDFGSFKLTVQHGVVKPGADSAVAIVFDTSGGWHYYAEEDTIPEGQLTITPSAEGVEFGKAIFPEPSDFYDEFDKSTYGVYEKKFTVYIPFKISGDIDAPKKSFPIKVTVKGAACEKLCKFLDGEILTTTIDIDPDAIMPDAAFEVPSADAEDMTERGDEDDIIAKSNLTMPIAFSLALLAGLLLNVMPCVWPVLPIIIARLWSLSGKSRGKSIGMGIGFSIGILLFFAIIAGVNIVLRVSFGQIMEWGALSQEPAFNIGLSMLMVVMGLFMFGLFTFTLPSSVSGKTSSGEGFSGSIGMGFLLALLSTPCGFGILAAAFAWAQSQTLGLATFTIMLIGVGMAVPFIVLTSIPGLLNNLPKPGGWMDHIKYILGFLMLLIAVKLLAAVPEELWINTLYFAVFLSLAVWMWGWVTLSTTFKHKLVIRAVAVIIAVGTGWLLFSPPNEKAVDWLEYDRAAISKDIEEGRPVLIKFTAKWCTTCTVIDKFVYSKKEVADFLKEKGVRPYLADIGIKGSAAAVDIREKYKEPAIPFTMIYLPDGKEVRRVGMYFKGWLYEVFGASSDDYLVYYVLAGLLVVIVFLFLRHRKKRKAVKE
ncbi:MAG: DUF255 domain-containing protein [Planctomycetes bacterium]|nr:DUF255 domain-containing protein [Planctomycetota bacterium]